MSDLLDIHKLQKPLSGLGNSSAEQTSSLQELCQWAADEKKEIIITNLLDDKSRNKKFYSILITSEDLRFVDSSESAKNQYDFSVETGNVSLNGHEEPTAEERLIERLKSVYGDYERKAAIAFAKELDNGS